MPLMLSVIVPLHNVGELFEPFFGLAVSPTGAAPGGDHRQRRIHRRLW